MRIPGYPILFRHSLYPIYNRLIGRDMIGFARDRLHSERQPASEMRALQFRKLKRVLVNAHENVPFYRGRFRELGFDPSQMTCMEDFSRLDFFVTKDDVRQKPTAFISENCVKRRLNWHYTGGSTGEPLYFATDPATDAASGAAMIRALRWWGVNLGEPHAILWGSPTYIVKTASDRVRRLAVGARDLLMNRLYISNYNLSTENILRYREKMERMQPSYVRGMPSSLYIFARTILDNGQPLEKGAPKFVHSACEQLYDWQKSVIEEGFNSPVANTYGLSEFGDIAFGAPCGKLHIMEEDVFLELRKSGNAPTEIVVTQLNNMMSPLIRYRTFDVSDRIAQCDCGLSLRVLEGLKGRAHDFIVAPDGRYLHGQIFTHLIVSEPGVARYQVRQEARDKLTISLVVNSSYKAETEEQLRDSINRYMGGGVSVDFKYVSEIPLTRAGKHRWIISDLVSGREN